MQKRDTKKMFAMKYMNKAMCIEKDAIKNVIQEMELLCQLDHPFLVNLWFTFQDQVIKQCRFYKYFLKFTWQRQ